MDQSGVEDCFSRPRVKGDLLWGAFEAWPSMWTVLNGPDAGFSRPSVIRDHIMSYLLENDLLSIKQYGFIKGRSTMLQQYYYG